MRQQVYDDQQSNRDTQYPANKITHINLPKLVIHIDYRTYLSSQYVMPD